MIENITVETFENYVFRPIKLSDAQSLYQLSKKARGGLSNLPKTLDQARQMILKSTQSFLNLCEPKNKRFLFAIENQKNKIVGISGIKARVGTERPNYSFLFNNESKYPTLELFKEYLGPSEIGSLFLSPSHRNQGIGRLLSLSRFLFIRSFNHHFTTTITAELRGFLHQNNSSPFWNNLGKKFIDMPFVKADMLSSIDPFFIEENFPKKPIYLQLLNPNVLKYIGQVHPFTEPAKKLLLSENFKPTNQIDIFDGGPKLACSQSKIRTIKAAKKVMLNDIVMPLEKEPILVCNQKFENFRCMKVTNKTPIQKIKQQLRIREFDSILFVKERP